jgi:hypothetical protein
VLARRQAARAGAHDRNPLRPVIHCSNDLEFCTLMSANVMIFGRTGGNTVCMQWRGSRATFYNWKSITSAVPFVGCFLVTND